MTLDSRSECCVFCGQLLDVAVAHCYCSTHCAERQLATLGTLLHSTPHLALSVLEWHELSQSYATDLELLNQVSVTLQLEHP